MPGSTTLYRFYDAEWRILYVGISWNPRERFGRHEDEKPWWEYVAFVRVDHYAVREAAEQAEQDTIREERPPFNTVAQNRYVREILTAARTVAHPPVVRASVRPAGSDRHIRKMARALVADPALSNVALAKRAGCSEPTARRKRPVAELEAKRLREAQQPKEAEA
jgi:hypothetical protein